MEEEEKGEGISDFSSLPEGVVAKILSFTTPSDACRSSVVSTTFVAAAQSDIVWDSFLPTDWEVLISRRKPSNLNFDPISSSKKGIFFSLCDTPLIIDDGNKVNFSIPLISLEFKVSFMSSRRPTQYLWQQKKIVDLFNIV